MTLFKITRTTLVVLLLFGFASKRAFSQPGKISNINYFNQYIKYNEDGGAAFENIQKLRIKLSDTLFVEKYVKDTLWLTKHREALYLNFLCYEYESRLTGGNLCKQQLGFDNYSLFYQFKDLKGFPQQSQYESEFEEAKSYQKIRCIKVYIQNNSDVQLIPESACGCKAIIKQLKEEQDLILYAAEKANNEAIQNKILLRQKEIQDSIHRLNEQIKYEPIYLSNGVLRADSTYKIKSSTIDSLNIFLVPEMLRASNQVFSYYVNNCASSNIEKMLDALQVQKNGPIYWYIKIKKTNGVFTFMDGISLNSLSSSMCLKLVSELFLNKISPYVNENEVLVLPFKVYVNSTYTDNRTVEYRIENGFVHIILPVIITDKKQLLPEIDPNLNYPEYEPIPEER